MIVFVCYLYFAAARARQEDGTGAAAAPDALAAASAVCALYSCAKLREAISLLKIQPERSHVGPT